MIIDHYHILIGRDEQLPCIQCKPDARYVEDLPCAAVGEGQLRDARITVVPIIRVDSGKPFVSLNVDDAMINRYKTGARSMTEFSAGDDVIRSGLEAALSHLGGG